MYETLVVRALRRALGLANQQVAKQNELIVALRSHIAVQEDMIDTFKEYRQVAQSRMAQQDTLIAAMEIQAKANESLIETQGFMLRLYRGW